MSQELQEDLQITNIQALDLDENLPELSFKKSVSQPPPGFYFNSDKMNILPNKEEYTPKQEETKEYNDILKQLKKYNPRFAAEFKKTVKNTSIEKNKTINENSQNNFFYQQFPKSKIMNEGYEIEEAVISKENHKQQLEVGQTLFYPNEPTYEDAFAAVDNFLLSNQRNYEMQFNQPYNYVDYSYMNLKSDEEKKHLKIKNLTESKKKQADYENGTKEQKQEVFNLAYQNLFEMIYDTYNNYVIQKILEIGEASHKQILFQKLKELPFIDISTHKFGCRVIQKAIEAFPDPLSQEYQFLRDYIFYFINDLIKHENGSLVVQKCLEKYKSDDFIFILNYINLNFQNLAYDKNGCLIIQKLFDIYPYKENNNLKVKINETIINIISRSFELSKKGYSNYIIQHLLETGHPEHKEKLLNQYVKPNFISLSCDQFASNVAEKSIINSDKEFRKNIWNVVMKNNDFLKLVNDKYGNYVMQRIYEYAEPQIKLEFENLLTALKTQLNSQGNFVMKFVLNSSKDQNF